MSALKRKETALARKQTVSRVSVIPLGGLNEIGKNMTAIECGDDVIIIDCGLTFPDEQMPGVDIVIPDITYLERNKSKVRGILLTHGHEDHYGAIPYVLKQITTNVYCTRLTGGLLETKYKEHGLNPSSIKYVKVGETYRFGKSFRCEFIRVAHSIPDACAIAIFNPVGTLLFTGDFKMDFTPIDNEPTDIHRLAQLGEEGILALFADSTNVERPGITMSERTVGNTFKRLFKEAEDRIIVATFASNLHRVQQIIWASEASGRKVCLSGRSMLNNVAVASELGYLKVKSNTLIDMNDIDKYKPSEVTLLITGTQGEPMSALSRMANDEHRKINITERDTVIISASMIPGNEKSIGDMINKLIAHGCNLVYSSLAEIHVSGHACQEELKMMHALTKPRFFAPIHGELRMLSAHKHLAMSMGMADEDVFLLENGSVLEFERRGKSVSAKVAGKVPAGQILVDGLGVGDVGNVVLNDRMRLADDGIIAIVITVDKKTRKVVAGPEVTSRGFVYMKDNIDIMEGIRKSVAKIFADAEKRNISDWSYLKSKVREDVKNYVFTEIKRNPMILSVIMEIEGSNGKKK